LYVTIILHSFVSHKNVLMKIYLTSYTITTFKIGFFVRKTEILMLDILIVNLNG